MSANTRATTSSEITPREVENARLSYEAALESVVLLENNGTLPLKKKGKIALYGSAVLYTIKGGTGSGEVNERESISILDGMERAGFTVTNQAWLTDYRYHYNEKFREHHDQMNRAMRKALLRMKTSAVSSLLGLVFNPPCGRMITAEDVAESGCDTCVFAIARQAGEAMDRDPDSADYCLMPEEIEQLKFLAQNYKKTIVVINTGACMNLSHLSEIKGIGAVVYMGLLGGEGGAALADILSGKTSPSGHLTATWMKSYDDVPYGRAYGKLGSDILEADYKEGIYVGYRYYDTFNVTPRYEFGYGKSYTTFMFQCLSAAIQKTVVSMRVSVTNTGNYYSGREVVQVYVCGPHRTERAYQQLAAFGKSKTLKPQASEELTLRFDMRDLARYDEESNRFIVDAGEYIIRIGNSSRGTIPYVLVTINDNAVISSHLPFARERQAVNEIPYPLSKDSMPQGLNRTKNPYMKADNREPIFRLIAKAGDFEYSDYTVRLENIYQTEDFAEDDNEETAKVLKALTDSDCIDIVVGDGYDLMGKPHDFNCPGAAGYTTSKLAEKGLTNIALCDGPAGLRVLKRSGLKGEIIRPLEHSIDFLKHLPAFVQRFMLGDEDKDTILYQYTTAFPAAGTLAQSWNTELLEAVGRAISREMSEYGCTFWLAPGMNIRRNPLCGRNFEYYSEDPLLSGKLAAAVTRGVEAIPGNYCTLKHFCCNNQETERFRMSSNVNERALREIYLRGFEIAVREAHPHGVMSSYNRLNGIYTANSYDLLTRVLRHEWGFEGVVMTDWGATNKGCADPALCLKTGNDLIMPGSKRDKKIISEALKKGLISEKDLRRSAKRIVKAVMEARQGNLRKPSREDFER